MTDAIRSARLGEFESLKSEVENQSDTFCDLLRASIVGKAFKNA